ATSRFKGDAEFRYQLPVSPFGTVTHVLAIPLWEVRPVDRRVRHEWWADDLETRETVVIGDGVREVEATIRLDDEQEALRTMLRLALHHDLTLQYRQNGVDYPVRLVEVMGARGLDDVPVEPDRERYGYGEYECRVRLRRTDGGTLDGIITSATF
ncbi:MAG: hypothetical protein L0271_24890, partial [Gemmatimonadetes bacterium]|nr:hypothetical protein [Gemmatimonadota bacterium]